VQFQYDLVIARPVQEVFAYVTDFQNCPEWNSKCAGACRNTDGRIGTGSVFTLSARVIGQRIDSTITIGEFVDNQRFTFHGRMGPIPFESEYRFVPLGSSTHLFYKGRMEPEGYLRLMAPVVALGVQREAPALYGRLKQILEARGT